MADPMDLQEASEAIHQVRGLAAVQRHKELDEPLRQAEEAPQSFDASQHEFSPGIRVKRWLNGPWTGAGTASRKSNRLLKKAETGPILT